MLIQILLIFQLLVFAQAGMFTLDHFINPPAEPIADPSTTNDFVSFDEGDDQIIKWITTFKISSLALIPVGADPVKVRATADFITRNVTTKSTVWFVAPPPGLGPGNYFFQLFQEDRGGTGNFGSHTFAINAVSSSSTSTSTSTVASSTSSSALLPVLSIASSTGPILPVITIASSTGPILPVITIASATGPPLPAVTIVSTTIAESTSPLPNAPDIASASSSSASTTTSTPSTSFLVAPFSGSSQFSSQSSTTSSTSSSTTEATGPIASAVADTQHKSSSNTFQKLTLPAKISVIVIPIVVVIAGAVAYSIYRFIGNRRGVEAMMKKSMRVKEMPVDGLGVDGMSKWRDSTATRKTFASTNMSSVDGRGFSGGRAFSGGSSSDRRYNFR